MKHLKANSHSVDELATPPILFELQYSATQVETFAQGKNDNFMANDLMLFISMLTFQKEPSNFGIAGARSADTWSFLPMDASCNVERAASDRSVKSSSLFEIGWLVL